MSFNQNHHTVIDHSALTGGVVVQAAEANLGATVGIAVNDAGATLVATKAELDATNAKLNALLAKLRSAKVLQL